MSGLMRERHNKIVHRLEGRLAGTVLIDQKVPNSSCQLRPDIVCIDHQNNKIVLIDVTIPGETNGEAFEKARNEKERKYGDLLQWCKDKYSEASYDSFVVGALGAYDTNNETALMWPKNTEPYLEGYASWMQSRVPMKFGRLDVPPQTQQTLP